MTCNVLKGVLDTTDEGTNTHLSNSLGSLRAGGSGWAVNERQAEALLRAREALERAAQSVQDGLPVDFWTIDVKDALLALGEVTGSEAGQDVLDRVFSTFCIGK